MNRELKMLNYKADLCHPGYLRIYLACPEFCPDLEKYALWTFHNVLFGNLHTLIVNENSDLAILSVVSEVTPSPL